MYQDIDGFLNMCGLKTYGIYNRETGNLVLAEVVAKNKASAIAIACARLSPAVKNSNLRASEYRPIGYAAGRVVER